MTIASLANLATNMDLNEIKITPLDKNDAHCVAKIEKEAFSIPFKESDILEYLCSPIWHFFTVKKGQDILGYISLTIIIDECQIVNVAVTNSARGCGLGSMLVEHALNFAKQNGCNKAFLEVRASNEGAIRLYKKFGFAESGISKNHYSLPREDALLMNLEM